MIKTKTFKEESCFQCHASIPPKTSVRIVDEHIFCSPLCYWIWKLTKPKLKVGRRKGLALKAYYKEVYGNGKDKYNPNLE